jgi:hypothetical protein
VDLDQVKEEMMETDNDEEEEEGSDSGNESDGMENQMAANSSSLGDPNGLNELRSIAQRLSGNFTVGPAQRANWSKLVYETNEGQQLEIFN